MRIIWKYLDSGEVKHQMYNDITRMAVCHVTHLDFLPNGWKDDKEGLAARRECRNCPVWRERDEKRKEALQG